MADKTVLLDGYSLLYRAYHGLSTPMNAPDGTPTNAIFGFMTMLLRVVAEEKPDRLAVAFDMHAPTFRARDYAAYKATRKPMPEELRAQDPIIRELLAQMDIPVLECEGYEADDILGTVSQRCERKGREALLVTGDRDSFQLSGPHTTILYTKKGITDTVRVTPEWIRETYGVSPEQLIDVKSLMGDTSDNIPGVPGVGEKTALKLIQEKGSLENVLSTADSDQKGKLRERLLDNADLARMSYHLAKIVRDAPVEAEIPGFDPSRLGAAIPRLRQLAMNQVIRRLNDTLKEFHAEAPVPEAPVRADLPPVEAFGDAAAFRARCEALAAGGCARAAFCLDTAFTAAVAGARLSLTLGGDLLSPGVSPEEAFDAARPLMDAAEELVVHDVKSIPLEMDALRGRVHDVMLAAYALNPQRPSFTPEALCQAEGLADYARHPAQALLDLSGIQKAQLARDGLQEVYRGIELPLAEVLRDMERAGFLVDAGVLERLGEDYTAHIDALVEEIARMAGARINLNSPKQLAELLFDRLKLPAASKKRSTSAEVLEELAVQHPICAKILEYRKYKKLQSTYIEALLALRDGNGRVHTTFDQVGTATGRISSSEPNLQNIPVRTELGREIRKAFVAPPGCVLVDADYSQIELRVLAHMAGDETMIDAFRQGQDIHARTAAEVYGVPLDRVTHEMRTSCKAVNFGIVYGISDFALARNIGVSRREARDFIDRYFERYPGVKRYMDDSVRLGYEQGYVTTLMGRRRYLPELQSGNYNLRSFGERCAMNSPIQGTAADIIKLAMVRVAGALKEGGFAARLLLQVHDELIIEAPAAESEAVAALLRDCMESIVSLSVPLKAEISMGGDWNACK